MQEKLSRKIISERIRNLRIEHDLSQEFISGVLNISRSNYSQIELGNQFPSLNTLHLIARYYSKSCDWILNGETNVNQNELSKEIELVITDMEATIESLNDSLKNLEQELIKIKAKTSGYSMSSGNSKRD